jgi:serine/threonine protein kinase
MLYVFLPSPVALALSAFMTVLVGTGRWMAPEVHSGSEDYTAKADVYSYGMLVWEALAKQLP